jgi:phospholipid/cholesterol/gamma-HCH transport system substrate-binding protein
MGGSGGGGTRIAAIAVVVLAVLVIGWVLLGSGESYDVKVRLQNASQLVKGNLVQVAGAPIGSVDGSS